MRAIGPGSFGKTSFCYAIGTLAVSLPLLAGSISSPTTAPCADAIIAKMIQADAVRDRSLRQYSATRHYRLRGDKKRNAEMTVRLDYRTGIGKTFEVLAQNGADGIYKRVFDKVLEAETESSRRNGEDNSISAKNYDFQFLGEEKLDGRLCYVIRLLPKRKSKYLIDGKAWIDAEEYALVRLQGRTSGSVSFWVGRPYIVQTYRKVGKYWLAAHNDSVAHVKIMGRMELMIDSSDYAVPGMSDLELADTEHVPAAKSATVD